MGLSQYFRIDPRLIPSKLAYFMYGAILGLHLPYTVLFCTEVGLSKTRAGYISGLRYLSAALTGPLWGYLADFTGRRKLIMVVISIGSAFPIFGMPWIAHTIYPNPKMNCTNDATFNSVSVHGSEREKQREVLFYILLAVTVFGSIFVMNMPGYVDSIVIHVVKTGKRKASYGLQRIFGSLGFTVANLLGGVATQYYEKHHPDISKYTAVFYMYLPGCLLLVPIGCYLVGQTSWTVDEKDEESKHEAHQNSVEMSISQKVWVLFKRFDVCFFMFTVFISGLANSLFLSFAYNLVIEQMHANSAQMTFVVSVASGSELIVFPLTSFIVKRIGTAPCITLGIFSYFIRFLVFSYAEVFWLAAVVQSLHGIGFALAWSATMEHTHTMASPEISGTLFNVMCALFYNFSALFANMVGGVMYDKLGGRSMFRWVAALCGVWTIFMLIYFGGNHVRNKIRLKNSVEYKGEQRDNKIVGLENPVSAVQDEKLSCK